MAPETKKAIIARDVDELNARNFSFLDEVVADHVRVRSRLRIDNATPPARLSRAQYAANIRARVSVLPDCFVTIDDMVGEEHRVVVYWSTRATRASELLGLPASGTRIREHAVTRYLLTGGRIRGVRSFWDNADLWQQLGLILPTNEVLHLPEP